MLIYKSQELSRTLEKPLAFLWLPSHGRIAELWLLNLTKVIFLTELSLADVMIESERRTKLA